MDDRPPIKESLRDSTLEKLMNGHAIDDLDSPIKNSDSEEKKLEPKKSDDEFDLNNPDEVNRYINKYALSKEESQKAKYNSENVKLKHSDMNEIDSLVEEELSRNSNDYSEPVITPPQGIFPSAGSSAPGTPS